MPLDLVVTPQTLGPAVAKMFADLERQNREAAIKALQRAAYLCQAEAVRAVHRVKPYAPINGASPGLVGSFVVTATPDGAILENTAPHAAFMEFGTRPHWAPIGPLYAWAEQKLRGKIKNKAKRVDPAMAFAKAVQRSIAKRGTTPRGFYAAASLKFPGIVEEQIRFALAKLGGR